MSLTSTRSSRSTTNVKSTAWVPGGDGDDEDGVAFRVVDLEAERKAKAKADKLAKKGLGRSNIKKPKTRAQLMDEAHLLDRPIDADPYLVLANRQPMNHGRRTSFALGLGIHQKIHELALDRRTAVNRERFRTLFSSRKLGQRVEDIFAEMDYDKNGTVSVAEFRKWCDKNGLSILHQDARQMIDLVDEDGNGSLSLGELRAILTKTTLDSKALDPGIVPAFHDQDHPEIAAKAALHAGYADDDDEPAGAGAGLGAGAAAGARAAWGEGSQQHRGRGGQGPGPGAESAGGHLSATNLLRRTGSSTSTGAGGFHATNSNSRAGAHGRGRSRSKGELRLNQGRAQKLIQTKSRENLNVSHLRAAARRGGCAAAAATEQQQQLIPEASHTTTRTACGGARGGQRDTARPATADAAMGRGRRGDGGGAGRSAGRAAGNFNFNNLKTRGQQPRFDLGNGKPLTSSNQMADYNRYVATF